LTFNDEEVDDESADEVAGCEDVAVTEIDVAGYEGCEKGWVIVNQEGNIEGVCGNLPRRKFQSQLEAVDNAIPFAR
jgi:hypothetical protein